MCTQERTVNKADENDCLQVAHTLHGGAKQYIYYTFFKVIVSIMEKTKAGKEGRKS